MTMLILAAIALILLMGFQGFRDLAVSLIAVGLGVAIYQYNNLTFLDGEFHGFPLSVLAMVGGSFTFEWLLRRARRDKADRERIRVAKLVSRMDADG